MWEWWVVYMGNILQYSFDNYSFPEDLLYKHWKYQLRRRTRKMDRTCILCLLLHKCRSFEAGASQGLSQNH